MRTTNMWGESASRDNAAAGGSASYRDILAKMAESLKPGGEIDKTYMADIDVQGKQLQAQLRASAIGRGLGGAQIGIPTQVFKQIGTAKQKVRSDLLQQYMSVLTNLAQLSFQEEQAGASRAAQTQQTTQGLDAFGRPMRGTLAAAELELANKKIASLSAPQPTMDALPSLAASAGYGQLSGGHPVAPSLFGGGNAGAAVGQPAWDYSLLPDKTAKLSGGGEITYW